jgi:hypothetical protein
MRIAIPHALVPGADIEEAYSRLPEAKKWLEHIRVVEKSVAEHGVELQNLSTLLSSLRHAREYAEQHVAVLTKRAAARSARRKPSLP